MDRKEVKEVAKEVLTEIERGTDKRLLSFGNRRGTWWKLLVTAVVLVTAGAVLGVLFG